MERKINCHAFEINIEQFRRLTQALGKDQFFQDESPQSWFGTKNKRTIKLYVDDLGYFIRVLRNDKGDMTVLCSLAAAPVVSDEIFY